MEIPKKVLEYILGWGSSRVSEACLIDRENYLNTRHFYLLIENS
jgi:hypothetical protein